MSFTGLFAITLMNQSIFKAYDIRGRYPEEINEEVVETIGKALGEYFKHSSENTPRIVLAHDARLSSPSLYNTLRKSLVASGYTPVAANMSTTPMLYFLVNHHKADGGIMVTASHNPKEWNGLKVVGKNAEPISGEKIFHLVDKSTKKK